MLPHRLPTAVRAELDAADAEIRPGGPLPGDTRTDQQLIAAFAADLTDFAHRHDLARTVVVNVASTEPAPGPDDPRLSASSLYAAAALRAGCSYVNFTPPRACAPPAGRRCRRLRTSPRGTRRQDRPDAAPLRARPDVPPACPARTGLVRVEPAGRRDGAALADPAAAAAKNAGKERVLTDTFGTAPEGEVHIDDVPAMGDWKTAWDHIAFDGFLGSRMILQTIWQGCDSALAAPLVLDLARLLARAHEVGLSGPRPELGFYFKDPDGGTSAALAEQYATLLAFAERLRGMA